jgi:plastocyanin
VNGVRTENRPRTVLARLLVLVALALPVAVTLPGPSPATVFGATPSSCLKIWHSKKVTKWVKRDGKPVKVTVTKRWWTCDPFESPGPPRLGVEASEWKFTLSRPEVKAGNLIVQLNNRGEDTHNLRIAEFATNRSIGAVPDTGSRRTRTGTFALKPGLYRLTCTLFGHTGLGMKAKLRVIPRGG